MNSYARDYIDSCRSRVDSQLAAYRALAATVGATPGSRTLEGKDGNPANEVRLLCTSVLQNGGVMVADKTIRMNPAKSVLKLHAGDRISLSEADFVRLSKAFFTEIEARFGQ